MKIRDRIKEFKRVATNELRPHPSNWRTHPDSQRDAFKSVLASIGIAGACIAFEPSDGLGLMLIDGHLRADELDKTPVLVLDLNDDEAKQLLASFDTVGAMAGVDEERINELIADCPNLDTQLLDELTSLAGSWETNLATPDDLEAADGMTDSGIKTTVRIVVEQQDKDEATTVVKEALEFSGLVFEIE